MLPLAVLHPPLVVVRDGREAFAAIPEMLPLVDMQQPRRQQQCEVPHPWRVKCCCTVPLTLIGGENK